MPVTERDRSRLAAIVAIVKPTDSLASRLETLTDNQREHYENWHSRYRKFIDQNPDGKAYELAMDGFDPCLPTDIREALFGKLPHLLMTDTFETIAEKYWRYAHG